MADKKNDEDKAVKVTLPAGTVVTVPASEADDLKAFTSAK